MAIPGSYVPTKRLLLLIREPNDQSHEIMHFEGTFETRAPPKKVYDFLLNPEAIGKCLPDLQKLEVRDQDHYNAAVKVGVGFIKGTFTFQFTVAEKDAPKKARLKAHGSGTGSTIDLEAVMELEEAKAGTRMNWKADAQVGGMMAGIGQRIISGTAEKTISQLFDCLRRQLG